MLFAGFQDFFTPSYASGSDSELVVGQEMRKLQTDLLRSWIVGLGVLGEFARIGEESCFRLSPAART